jgi:hypothetical protein
MVVGTDKAPLLEAKEDQYGAEPMEEVDPSTLASLCGEAEFNELVDEMVADEAPRLFAVVQVYGDWVDGRIAAWGMAFEDHAEVVSVDGRTHMSLRSAERAVRGFRRRPDVNAHLVWVNPDAASSPDEIDAA